MSKKIVSDYTRFGVVGVLFEMIPFLNLVTPVTNVIGSALWACDIERFKEPLSHPRSYLLAPSPALIETRTGGLWSDKK